MKHKNIQCPKSQITHHMNNTKTNDEQQLLQAQQADNVLYYTNTAITTYLIV